MFGTSIKTCTLGNGFVKAINQLLVGSGNLINWQVLCRQNLIADLRVLKSQHILLLNRKAMRLLAHIFKLNNSNLVVANPNVQLEDSPPAAATIIIRIKMEAATAAVVSINVRKVIAVRCS